MPNWCGSSSWPNFPRLANLLYATEDTEFHRGPQRIAMADIHRDDDTSAMDTHTAFASFNFSIVYVALCAALYLCCQFDGCR